MREIDGSCRCPAAPGEPCPATKDECALRAAIFEKEDLETDPKPREVTYGDSLPPMFSFNTESGEIQRVIEVAKLEIAKLEIGPSDTLVVRVSEEIASYLEHEHIQLGERLAAIFPHGVKVLVIDKHVELQVVKCAVDESVIEKPARTAPERIIELPDS